MAYTKVVVQTADFDAGKESAALLAGDIVDGALVTFTGLVRGGGITAMELEHYPEMTEKSLRAIVDDARRRWPVLGGVTIIHRVGKLLPGDQIVLVIVASPHRAAAFEAAEFMMDWLKTEAPFWKKEYLTDGTAQWVDARETDEKAKDRWNHVGHA